MKVQKYQYCPSCGDELILEDGKYVCARCLGNYDNRSKLNVTENKLHKMKHIKLFENFLNENNDDTEVWVHIIWRGNDILCTLNKFGNKWMENQQSGPQLPQFGRTHLGMTPENVVRNLNSRFGSAKIISEEEALELI